jgi:hypothetical protein
MSANQSLWNAVVAKNTKAAKAVLENGADANTFRIPIKNGNQEFREITETSIDHDNKKDHGNRFPEYRDYVSVMMVAAHNNDVPMLALLAKHGANINLAQPTLCYSDGYAYGKMTPICFALDCRKTTKWFIDNGADVNITIVGLPGYDYIDCPDFSPLLLAHYVVKNNEVSRLLVESGADVNHYADKNGGRIGEDICCYWRSVVKLGDVTWAEQLLTKFHAYPRWPIAGDCRADLVESGNFDYDYHPGLRETVLMSAVVRGDMPMVQLLLKHGANANDPEHINLSDERLLVFDLDPQDYETEDYCQNRCATAFSLALGNASVPDSAIVEDSRGEIQMIREPYCNDPILAALIEVSAEDSTKTHVAAARTLRDDVAWIMPTQEEIKIGVANLSEEKRATYTRIKAEKLAAGIDEETAKKTAFDVATADPEYDEDSAYGTESSDSDSDDSADEYEEEVYEFDSNNNAIIMDVDHE